MGSGKINTPLLQHSNSDYRDDARWLNQRSQSRKPPKRAPVRDERWLHFYRQMLKIRLFEEQVNQLYLGAKMPGLAHLYIGEEAVAVGVCEALRHDDYITSTHRGHGHCIAKGAAVDRMFAELLGKEAGYCRGKGGSMHIADQDTGNLGANAIVGGSAGIATGAAMSIKMRGSDQVAVCFFGDGALGQGLLYETMNMASLWKLPVDLCLREQSIQRIHPLSRNHCGRSDRSRHKPSAFTVESVDGQDVRAVHATALKLVETCAPRRRPVVFAMQHLPFSRPSRRRHRPRLLSIQSGRGRVENAARSDQAARRLAAKEQDWRTASYCRRIEQRSCRAEIKDGCEVRAQCASIPVTNEVDQHVYA